MRILENLFTRTNNSFRDISFAIQQLLELNYSKFIIYPFGHMGVLCANILNTQFNIKPYKILDNNICKYNPEVFSVGEGVKEAKLDASTIVLFNSQKLHKELLGSIETVNVDVLILFPYVEKIKELKPQYTSIGRYSYGPLVRNDRKIKKIGSFCSFADGVDAVWNHQLDMVTNHDFIYESKICSEIDNQKITYEELNREFEIGNDVWLGKNVILTNGVKIGNGARAAAGSVITRDVPDYAVVAGVPAKIMKYRFDKEQIRKLNEIAWWDWPVEKIKESYDDFMDIEIFLKRHYKA